MDGVAQRGQALVLRGEPGIGKSRLLAETARTARDRGLTLLTTAGVQSEAHLPFAGLHQLLRPVRDRACSGFVCRGRPQQLPSADRTAKEGVPMDPARLQDLPFFSSLSEENLAAIAQHIDELSVAAGSVLAREGDLGDKFFVIESGTAEVTRGGAPFAKLGAGDFFGEIALIREERRIATVTATSAMTLIVMAGSSLRSLDSSRPEIRETISKALAERPTPAS